MSGRTQQEPEPKTGRSKRKQLPLWQETILLLGVALVLAIVIKTFFVQAFYIPSESMEPGLILNDRILIQKVSYWGDGEPERGDVVVFKDPGGWLPPIDSAGPTNPVAKAMAKIGLYPTGGHLVKRVIGTEGDVIVCCDEQGRIEVNGMALDEDDYVRHDSRGCDGFVDPFYTEKKSALSQSCSWTIGPVPAGKLFVMGDNRNHSADSTVHMCRENQTDCVPGDEFVPVDLVVGKVWALIWPWSRAKWVHTPETFKAVPNP